MTRNGLLAVTAVAALGVTGCGSNKNKSSSYSAFSAKANTVCKAATASLKPVSAKLTGNPKTDAAVYDTLIPKLQAATDSFKALKPPSELKADFDKFNLLTQAQVEGAKKAQAAAKAGNRTTYIATVNSISVTSKKANLVGSKLGAAACAK